MIFIILSAFIFLVLSIDLNPHFSAKELDFDVVVVKTIVFNPVARCTKNVRSFCQITDMQEESNFALTESRHYAR